MLSLSVKNPIAAIIKPIHIKKNPMPIMVSIAPIQMSVPAVLNRFSPERSANAWKQSLTYFIANSARMKPMIRQGMLTKSDTKPIPIHIVAMPVHKKDMPAIDKIELIIKRIAPLTSPS